MHLGLQEQASVSHAACMSEVKDCNSAPVIVA